MAIDKAEYHIDDAGEWEDAARHIALFLLLADRHDLTSEDVDSARLARAPIDYLLQDWDGVLADDVFTARGLAFASAHYSDYLEEYGATILDLGAYDLYDCSEVDIVDLIIGLTPWFTKKLRWAV